MISWHPAHQRQPPTFPRRARRRCLGSDALKLYQQFSYADIDDGLEGEQEQESHHETEETHSLGQGEAQDGVREQLLLQGWVPGVADDQRAEYGSNTSTWNENYVYYHGMHIESKDFIDDTEVCDTLYMYM